jgi:hypothetical protein
MSWILSALKIYVIVTHFRRVLCSPSTPRFICLTLLLGWSMAMQVLISPIDKTIIDYGLLMAHVASCYAR